MLTGSKSISRQIICGIGYVRGCLYIVLSLVYLWMYNCQLLPCLPWIDDCAVVDGKVHLQRKLWILRQNGFLGFSRSFVPFSVWIYVPLSLLWILILHQFFPTNQLAWHGRIGNSLWTTDIFPVVTSVSPKNNICERDRQNDFCDLKPFVLMFANQIKGEKAVWVTPRDLVLWCVLDFGESYQVRFGTWISGLQQGFLRYGMLASCWSNGFLSYVCDVGLWFHFIKYGTVVHNKQNLDKKIPTAKGKYHSIMTACSDPWFISI